MPDGKPPQWKAKIQLQRLDDYNHLLTSLSRNYKLLKFTSLIDCVLDSSQHELWAQGLTLLIRYSSQSGGSTSSSLGQTCTIAFKETIFHDVDPERPYFEVSEKEERTEIDEEIWMILKGKPISPNTKSHILQHVASKYPNQCIQCIGSYRNICHYFEMASNIVLEVDRTTFSFGEAFFCRFSLEEEIIQTILQYLQNEHIMYEINMSSKTALFFDRLYEADRASSSRANNTALLPPEANAGYDNSMTRANHSASAFSAASVGSHGRSYSHADLTSRLLESSGTSSYPAVLAPNSHHNLDHTNGHRESGKLNTSAHCAQPATSAFLESSSSAWARHSETRPEFESRSTFQSPEFLAKSGTNFNTSIVSSRTEFIAIDHPVRSTLAQGSESGSIVTPRSYYVRSDSARSRSPPVSSYPHSQSHDAPLPPTRPSHHSYLPPSSRSADAPEPNGHLPTYHPPVSSDNPPVALTGQGWVDRSVPPSSKSSYHLDSATHHSHFVGPSREPFTGRGPLYPPSSSAAPMRISSIASHDSTTPPLHPSMAIKDRAEGWERLPPTWDSSHVSRPPIPSYSTNHTHAVSGDDPRMDASGDRASSVLATDHSVERNDHPDLHGVASPLSIKSNGSAHDSHADEHQSSHAAAASFEEEQKRKSRDASARYRKRKNQEFEDQKKTISKLKAMVQSLETENTVLKRHIKALMSNKDQSKAPAEPTGSKDSARPPSDPA